MQAEHSRALRLAEQATGLAQPRLKRRLDDSTVVISVDADMPMSRLTARVLVATLRRGLGNLVLNPDGLPSELVDELERTALSIDQTRPLRIERRQDGATTRVHIGTDAPGGVIRVVPDGYGAHIAGVPSAVIRLARPANGLGAIYAAALGAAEVFKHTAGVVSRRRVMHRHLRFCPVSLSTDLSAAPDIDERTLDLTVIGLGASGTGIALILGELPLDGRIVAVDRQRFAPENRGTYSLGGWADVAAAPWKVDLAMTSLSRFSVTPFHEPVEQLIAAVDAGLVPWFPTVLTALDSSAGRREAQRLWPDRLIDAATGDTMLGIHDHRHGVDPCMMCVFPANGGGPSGADQIANRLGLSTDLLAHADTLLSEEHLTGLDDEQRRVLEPHLGTPMCGLAHATGLTDIDDDYQPSVPFVSLQAACLSMGRLLGALQGVPVAANLVQYDGLFGPQTATRESMRSRPDCMCSVRSTAITQVRTIRAANTGLN